MLNLNQGDGVPRPKGKEIERERTEVVAQHKLGGGGEGSYNVVSPQGLRSYPWPREVNQSFAFVPSVVLLLQYRNRGNVFSINGDFVEERCSMIML